MPAVDPLLTPRVWDNPELVRQFNAVQSYRFFQSVTGTTLAVFTAGDVNSEIFFIDLGRTDMRFDSSRVRIANDGGTPLEYSFADDAPVSGVVHGRLEPGEVFTDDERREKQVYIRHVGGVGSFRVWAW